MYYRFILFLSIGSVYAMNDSQERANVDPEIKTLAPHRAELVPAQLETVTEPKIDSSYDEQGNVIRKEYISRYSVMPPADKSAKPETNETFTDFNFKTKQ